MGTVWVACCVPNGVNIGGAVLNGSGPVAAAVQAAQRAGQKPPPFPGGYALTEVDAAAWETWVKTHPDSDLLARGLVFADADRNVVVARARGRRASAGMGAAVPRAEPGAHGRGVGAIGSKV